MRHLSAYLFTRLKIYAKVLASRLLHQPLIHKDQVGFLLTREARDNTMRVLDLIQVARSTGGPYLLLLMDAEKAFNRVDWQYLEEVLRYVGLGERMLASILALYSKL